MPSVTEMSLWIPGRVRVARRDGTVCRTRTCDSRFWMARKFYAVSCRVAPANSYMEKPMEWV